LYIFLAAKAVAMILNGVTVFIRGLFPNDPNAVAVSF
jgi:hypothetical protein